jgi:hypothetical protein
MLFKDVGPISHALSAENSSNSKYIKSTKGEVGNIICGRTHTYTLFKWCEEGHSQLPKSETEARDLRGDVPKIWKYLTY